MLRPVRTLRVDAAGGPREGGDGDDRAVGVGEALVALSAALDGSGPALLPVAADLSGDGDGPGVVRSGVATEVALLLPTSGSSGPPRLVELSAAGLLASAAASHARLGGPGQWLLALPLTHVAGWQVLVRSLVAGCAPAVATGGGSGWPAALAAVLEAGDGVPDVHDHREGAGRGVPDVHDHREGAGQGVPDVHDHGGGVGRGGEGPGRRYAALVPTQLARLLDDPAATAAAAGLDAVLLGGAATPSALARRAAAAGVRVVAGYGMTETCGGCVYDGDPLDGVDVRVDATGRIQLAGPVLARGYHDDGAGPGSTGAGSDGTGFAVHRGMRWFATPDVGHVDEGGGLTVLGRLDDVLVTGGEKVSPAAVEAALADLEGVREALVVGVPDAEWGQAVVALVVARGAPPDPEHVRAHVADRLGRPSAPRHVLVVADMPRRGPGKPDRRAAAGLAARRLGRPPPRPPGPALA